MIENMLLWQFSALCAFFVKGLCGFANTLVFTSILNFTAANVSISPVELLLGAPTNIILAIKERKAIDLKLCLPMSAIVVIGSLPGILLLKNADTGFIRALFGVVTMLVGLEMLLRGNAPVKGRDSGAALIVISLLSGVLCGLFGVGAFLGAYMSRMSKDIHAFKANLCMVFLAENVLRIGLYTAFGILTRAVLFQALTLVPAMLAGMGLGMACAERIDERLAKKLVIFLLILSGVALVLKAF